MWLTSRCISCTRAVTDEGTTIAASQSARIGPPSPPISPVVASFPARASRSAARTLGLRPDVEMPTATSPGRPSPCTWRLKTASNPISLAAAVNVETSTVRATAGMAARSALYRITSSQAMCCAFPALPPLPKMSSLPPRRIALSQMDSVSAKGAYRALTNDSKDSRCSPASAVRNASSPASGSRTVLFPSMDRGFRVFETPIVCWGQ